MSSAGRRRDAASSATALLGVFAVALLLAVIGLGAALMDVHRTGTAARTLDDARASARLLAQASVLPAVAGQDLERGLDVAGLADLGASVDSAVRDGRVIEMSLMAPSGVVVYPPRDIGNYPHGLLDASGIGVGEELQAAELTTAALPFWLGGTDVRAVRASAPVVAPSDGRVVGVLEVVMPYERVAEEAERQARVFAAVLLVGLITLYAVVAALAFVVTRRLRIQLRETDHQARHDPLTGLPNRLYFRESAESALRDPDADVVVAIVDLDRFKQVNDTLGHQAGDVLLREVGQRLAASVRTDDTVARLGGDEFGLVLPGLTIEAAGTVLDRVRAALRTPCRVSGNLLPVSGSVGLAAAPQHGRTVEDLLRQADVAMYVAKMSGRGMVATESPTDDGGALDHLLMEAELSKAMVSEELVLHYQPLVDLCDGSVGAVEALVRWRHPRRGLLGPDQFLPLAETTGQIHALTWWVLHRALADLAAHPEHMGVAVNVSPTSLRDDDFCEGVVQCLGAAGIAPDRLTLEMTETALVSDVEAVRRTLEALRAAGVQLSLDDFGQGSTSLGFLGVLPFTEVKVDRAFVATLPSGGLQRTIISAIVAIAHEAGMRVVAEGVESSAVLEAVRELGCDVAQGYHLGRPAAAEGGASRPSAGHHGPHGRSAHDHRLSAGTGIGVGSAVTSGVGVGAGAPDRSS